MKRKYILKLPLKRIPAIYIITCSETEKLYIGETVNVSQRIQKHFSLLRKNSHSNPILQNIFNKYGEDTFTVDILEFLDTTDELILKTKEKDYQEKYPNCISLDSNKVFVVERTEEWKKKQAKQLNNIREKGLENWRVPIIIYDIVNKTFTKYEQLTDADKIIEQKHIYKNIKEKILIPYKNRYVAFKEEDFTEENISKIISVSNKDKYCAIRNLCNLYNLIDNTELHFSSKRQFSLAFSNSPNDKLYDRYKNNNLLDFFGRCVNKPQSKKELYLLNINLRKRLSKTKCSFEIWYKALTSSTTNKEVTEKSGINRSTLQDIFKERSWIEWVQFMDKLIAALPD